MMSDARRELELRASWTSNATAWTRAVREGHIASRRAGTDAAIVRACERLGLGRVLDVGCGEGWLARALAERGAEVLGVDGTAELIELARAAGGGAEYRVVSYEALATSTEAAGPWDLVLCNFALLGESLVPLVRGLATRLAPGGALLIQTLHPWVVAAAAPPYRDGWRTETFSTIPVEFTAAMPWYFRTLSSWVGLVREAGLRIAQLEEPVQEEGGAPLSLLMECRA